MTELTPDLICRAGIALHGPEWQAPLAASLGVNDRTIRRIAQAARTGQPYGVNPSWKAELAQLLTRAAIEHEMRGREAMAVAELLSD